MTALREYDIKQAVAIEITDTDTRRGFAFVFEKKNAIKGAQLRDRRDDASHQQTANCYINSHFENYESRIGLNYDTPKCASCNRRER